MPRHNCFKFRFSHGLESPLSEHVWSLGHRFPNSTSRIPWVAQIMPSASDKATSRQAFRAICELKHLKCEYIVVVVNENTKKMKEERAGHTTSSQLPTTRLNQIAALFHQSSSSSSQYMLFPRADRTLRPPNHHLRPYRCGHSGIRGAQLHLGQVRCQVDGWVDSGKSETLS